MATTEKHEHALTQKALDILTTGGKNPGTDGEESINFSVSRQGTPSDACLAFGDCTPFTPAGRRGILKGQPAGFTGQPMAYIDNFSSVTPTLNQLATGGRFLTVRLGHTARFCIGLHRDALLFAGVFCV